MKMVQVLTGTVLALLSLTVSARIDLSQPGGLRCDLNRSHSLYIYGQKGEVYFKQAFKEPKKVVLTSFIRARCPSCFSFSGKVNGLKIVAQTTIFEKVTLNYSLDGAEQRPVDCHNP